MRAERDRGSALSPAEDEVTRRPGRPSLPPAERRTAREEVRLTEAEKARYSAAAEAAGTTLADVARKAWEWLAKKVERST